MSLCQRCGTKDAGNCPIDPGSEKVYICGSHTAPRELDYLGDASHAGLQYLYNIRRYIQVQLDSINRCILSAEQQKKRLEELKSK